MSSTSTLKFKPKPGLKIEVPNNNESENTTSQLTKRNRSEETLNNCKNSDLKIELNKYMDEINQKKYDNLNKYIVKAFGFLQVCKPKFSKNDDDIELRKKIIEINENIPIDNINDELKNKFEAMKKGLPNTFGGKKYKKTRKHSKKHRKSKRKSRKNKRKQ